MVKGFFKYDLDQNEIAKIDKIAFCRFWGKVSFIRGVLLVMLSITTFFIVITWLIIAVTILSIVPVYFIRYYIKQEVIIGRQFRKLG